MRNTPFLLALDISATRTGVAEGRIGDVPKLYSVKFKKSDESHEDVFGAALTWFVARLQQRRPDFLVVERRLAMTKINPETLELLCGLPAIIQALARTQGVQKLRLTKAPGYSVAVSTIRAGFLGKGNLKSADAKGAAAHMCRLLGWEFTNNDESDAAAVWWWAASRLYPELAPAVTPLMQQEAVSVGMGASR